MTPYYEDESATIYHGDCQKLLPSLGVFDLLLTDPPYGLGDRMKGGTWGGSEKYDVMRTWDQKPPSTEFLLQAIAKSNQAILWGGNYFSLPASRCFLIWDKCNAVPTMASAEIAWTNFDKPIKTFRGKVGEHTYGHPTQKPEELFRWCLSFAPDAKTIFDPFMGSGTTLVAARLEGRRAVGVELEERYCEIAAKRLSQQVLF